MPGEPVVRLPKVARLCGPAAFKAVMSKPALAKSPHFVLHAMVRDGANLAEIGAVLPKRWAKRAVTRNAIRRQIMVWFDALRRNRPEWSECRSVVVRLRGNFHGDAGNAKASKGRGITKADASKPATPSVATMPPQATSRALKRAVQAELQGLTCALR